MVGDGISITLNIKKKKTLKKYYDFSLNFFEICIIPMFEFNWWTK